jgi:hypothetical protein
MKGIIATLFSLLLSTFLHAQQPAVEWIRKYGSTLSNTGDIGFMLTTDDTGNVYVTGVYNANSSGGGNNFGTIKYDPSGNIVWDTTYNGPGGAGSDDQAYFIAIDDTGNVYICGISQQVTVGDYDYCTIKYSPSGNPIWINRYDRSGSNEDRPGKMKIDKRGNIYVTGYTYNAPTVYDYTTVKYDTGGNTQWIRHYDGLAGQDDYAYALDVDDSGFVYVSGSEYFGGSGDYYMTTIKYDSLGVTKWIGKFVGPVNDYAQGIDMAADDSGNVYVLGWYDNLSNPYESVLIKYDRIGDSVWVIRDDSLLYQPVSILRDRNGDILVTGRGYSGYTITIKYDPSGNKMWKANFNQLGSQPTAMTSDKMGSIYVTGTAAGAFPNPDMDYWTVKYDSLGAEKWRVSYNGPTNNNDLAESIALDTLGNIFVTGRSWESGSNTQFGTIKYNQNVGINELDNSSLISLFPNPSSTQFVIQSQITFNLATIELYNCVGEQVRSYSKISGNSFTIKREDLSSGLYFVKVIDKEKTYSTKVIIQ